MMDHNRTASATFAMPTNNANSRRRRISGLLILLTVERTTAFVSQKGPVFTPARIRHSMYLPSTDGDVFNKPSQQAADSNEQNVVQPEFSAINSKDLESLNGGGPPMKELPNGGRISMVGSGPGDPDLLTMAAHKLLTDPNALVVSDRLVSPEILDLIASENIKVARKMPGCADLAQEEIYNWCHEGLKNGQHVVRLKIGDPFVFGRGGEEVLTFRRFGVEPTIIPGVSAAFSAPLLASIPVTHRGVSNQVVMCTGYGREGTSPDLIQYHKEQTIVFLMAVGRLRELCHRLITLANYPSSTPVAIVERAGCPQQRTVVGTMETIADLADQHKVVPPSTIIVGDVVNVLLDTDSVTGQTVTGLIQQNTVVESSS